MAKIRKRGVSHVVMTVLAYMLAAFVLIQLGFLLQIIAWKYVNPSSSSMMREQMAILHVNHPDYERKFEWVGYERISLNLKRAIIASEDARFAEHGGVEWDALEGAYKKNERRGKVVAGGSTITQQLAKNLFLSGERSYLRKGEELIITYMLEAVLDKQRIFEIYLNIVEWGTGVYGAQAGARHYYGLPAMTLGASQAARMAVMLPRPRYYDAHRNSAYLNARTSLILRRMGSADLP